MAVRRSSIVLALCLALLCQTSWASKKLEISIGSSSVIAGKGISQVAISNPVVLDVQPVSTTEVLVTGLAAGSSQLFIWDKVGRAEYEVSVAISSADATTQARLINEALTGTRVTAEAAGDRVILRGEVASNDELRRCEAVAKALSQKVDNLVTVNPASSEATLAAIRTALSPWKVTVTPTPDGKVMVSGKVSNISAMVAVRNAVEPWRKSIEFAFDLTTDKSPAQETVEGLLAMFSKWGLTASVIADGRVLLDGMVPDQRALDQVVAVLKDWPREVTIVSNVRLTDAAHARQVLIRARVVELSRTNLKDIGVDWSRILFSESSSGTSTFSAEDQPFIIGQGNAGPFPLFGGPPIQQLDPIGARISALIQQNRARLLSQPSLVTTSGAKANILVGGEIPVPVPQAGVGAGAAITIIYKPFGISLDVLPIVSDDGRISMLVKPEVSVLDYANGIVMSGFVVPALRTRRAESMVNVCSGQSIVIGGLFTTEDIKNVKGIPLLADIPVIGNFFKKTSTQKRDTELIIVVTPEIVCSPEQIDALKDAGPTPESLAPEGEMGNGANPPKK